MEDFPKWLLRIMVVVGAIAFLTTYWMRHDWSQGWAPRFNTEDYTPPPPRASEPAAPAAAAAPAAEAGSQAAPAAASAGARGFAPCQPIGRTARGDLVYSMDCRTPPQ